MAKKREFEYNDPNSPSNKIFKAIMRTPKPDETIYKVYGYMHKIIDRATIEEMLNILSYIATECQK